MTRDFNGYITNQNEKPLPIIPNWMLQEQLEIKQILNEAWKGGMANDRYIWHSFEDRAKVWNFPTPPIEEMKSRVVLRIIFMNQTVYKHAIQLLFP